jgi:hypothetical protein
VQFREKFTELQAWHEWFVYAKEIRDFLIAKGKTNLPQPPPWTTEAKRNLIEAVRRRVARARAARRRRAS